MKKGDLVICIEYCKSRGKYEPCSKGSIHKLNYDEFKDKTLGLDNYTNVFDSKYFKPYSYNKLIFKTYI